MPKNQNSAWEMIELLRLELQELKARVAALERNLGTNPNAVADADGNVNYDQYLNTFTQKP